GLLLMLMPLAKFFTVQELADSMTDAGFWIDYQWQPDKGKAVFMVAKKTG
ncbi:MAG: SAM-dependent methyltransferase, partial [Merismopedia sp. SIO2A8]|nr:SAM-dependent methyltransferase [Merismopedia sp. SIO2A8]